MKNEFNPEELIIENGGDIFVHISSELSVQLFAGNNEKFKNLLISIPGNTPGIGICTSSGMFGHSFSFGKADAVTVVCDSAAYADAFATSFGNRVLEKKDIEPAIKLSEKFPEILNLIIIKDDELGIRGNFPLKLS